MPTPHSTPLRYPGGKTKLAAFVQELFEANELFDGHYVEPYAGGAGIALHLLFLEYASHIHLNDLNLGVYSFWNAVLDETDWLCGKIHDTAVTVQEWNRQKEIYRQRHVTSSRDLGFAFFFLNRTNRSGILNGGIIGGKEQLGEWKIDARYNAVELQKRVEKVAAYRSRISIYCRNAFDFIRDELPQIPRRSLVYVDPPYYLKGGRLYDNYYKKADHKEVAHVVQSEILQPWIVSYDNTPDIVDLYASRRRACYSLDYSASRRTVGTEVMFFSDDIVFPGSNSHRMVLTYPCLNIESDRTTLAERSLS